MLTWRAAEQQRIDELLRQAVAGSSAVLVPRGDPGIGKTALVGYAASRAAARMWPPGPRPGPCWPRIAAIIIYLYMGQFLSKQRTAAHAAARTSRLRRRDSTYVTYTTMHFRTSASPGCAPAARSPSP